jgi:hypothetical protein
MGKIVREVYTYTSSGGKLDNKIPLAAPSSSIGTTLTNTAEIVNNGGTPLYDKKGNIVGKVISNRNVNVFENNTGGYVSNIVFLFDDGSYVMTLKWINSDTANLPSNTKSVVKSISTGGKYADKVVTVTIKSDETLTRKVILKYEE